LTRLIAKITQILKNNCNIREWGHAFTKYGCGFASCDESESDKSFVAPGVLVPSVAYIHYILRQSINILNTFDSVFSILNTFVILYFQLVF